MITLFQHIREDIRTAFAKDPAARSVAEIIFCYPGLHAIWLHRIAHRLWRARFRFCARFIAHIARMLTGVDIHPGAKIGRRVFIDHGMGVVIGETAEVGDDVLIYQGAVLGGTSLEKKKRHPTIGPNVVIGAGAILLGPIEVGANSRVGAGSVVIDSVPPDTTVVGVPAHSTERRRRLVGALEHGKLPDPIAEAIAEVRGEVILLRERVRRLEHLAADKTKASQPS